MSHRIRSSVEHYADSLDLQQTSQQLHPEPLSESVLTTWSISE